MSNFLRTRNNCFLDDDLFSDFFNEPVFVDNKHLMKTDIKENEKDFEITIDMPGYDKENIKMSLDNGYLTVEGHVEKVEKDNGDKKHFLRRERYYGSMSRSYYVGDSIKEEDIKASFKNGVLNVIVPKKVEKKLEEKKYIAIE